MKRMLKINFVFLRKINCAPILRRIFLMGAHFIFLTVYFCFGQLKFYFKVKLKQGLVRKGNESGVGGVCDGVIAREE